jgi:hypothetical protein
VNRTFRDRTHERALKRDGFVVIRGLAAPEDLLWLRELCDRSFPLDRRLEAIVPTEAERDWRDRMAPGAGWRISMNEAPPEDRGDLEERLAPYWEAIASELLVDHRAILTTLLSKENNDDSVLPLHQDPTFVDERRYRAVTVWIALDEISAPLDNGPLCVIPGSHRAGDEPRGTGTVPRYLADLDRLWEAADPVDVAAGDAVIWESHLIHGSPANRSPHARRAVTAIMVPRGVPLLHVVTDRAEAREFDVLQVDDTFWHRNSPRSLLDEPPEGYPVVDVIRDPVPTTTEAILAAGRRNRSRSRRRRRSA